MYTEQLTNPEKLKIKYAGEDFKQSAKSFVGGASRANISSNDSVIASFAVGGAWRDWTKNFLPPPEQKEISVKRPCTNATLKRFLWKLLYERITDNYLKSFFDVEFSKKNWIKYKNKDAKYGCSGFIARLHDPPETTPNNFEPPYLNFNYSALTSWRSDNDEDGNKYVDLALMRYYKEKNDLHYVIAFQKGLPFFRFMLLTGRHNNLFDIEFTVKHSIFYAADAKFYGAAIRWIQTFIQNFESAEIAYVEDLDFYDPPKEGEPFKYIMESVKTYLLNATNTPLEPAQPIQERDWIIDDELYQVSFDLNVETTADGNEQSLIFNIYIKEDDDVVYDAKLDITTYRTYSVYEEDGYQFSSHILKDQIGQLMVGFYDTIVDIRQLI